MYLCITTTTTTDDRSRLKFFIEIINSNNLSNIIKKIPKIILSFPNKHKCCLTIFAVEVMSLCRNYLVRSVGHESQKMGGRREERRDCINLFWSD